MALRIHENHKPGTPPTTSGPIRDRDMNSPAMRETWRKTHALGLAIQMHFIPFYAPQIGALAEQFREMPVILDHLARAGQGTPAEYEQVLKLARLPRVYMKFSGVEVLVEGRVSLPRCAAAGAPHVRRLRSRPHDLGRPGNEHGGIREKHRHVRRDVRIRLRNGPRQNPRAKRRPAVPIQVMNEIKLITLDPGHFHAALIQKEMYPEVSQRSTVYAPLGPDVIDHLQRVARFNLRSGNPTSWEIDVHTGPDFLERMIAERPGNVVVLSGRNRRKIDLIQASVNAGLHVLADKPWIIDAADLPKLEATLAEAARRGVVAYDIMTERYEITSILQRELVNDAGDLRRAGLGLHGERPPHHEDWWRAFPICVRHGSSTSRSRAKRWPTWARTWWTWRSGRCSRSRRSTIAKEIQFESAGRWPMKMTPARIPPGDRQTRERGPGLLLQQHSLIQAARHPGKDGRALAVRSGAGHRRHLLCKVPGTKASVEIRQGAPENYRPELIRGAGIGCGAEEHRGTSSRSGRG